MSKVNLTPILMNQAELAPDGEHHQVLRPHMTFEIDLVNEAMFEFMQN